MEYENLEINFWQDDELIVATSDKKLNEKEFYIDELLEQKWILREVGSGLRDKFLNEIGASSKKLNIFLELDRMAAIKELVLQKKSNLYFFQKKHRKRIKKFNTL